MRDLVLQILCILFSLSIGCQEGNDTATTKFWHDIERSVRYHPEGNSFVIENGSRRFNRALYGGNSGFRVETGDLPEIALYMPRLGGTLRLGISKDEDFKWMIDAENIKARYIPGKMTYTITDPLVNGKTIFLEVLSMYHQEGVILRYRAPDIGENNSLVWVFGGASDQRFSREGDIGADPESVFYLKPENCINNKYYIDGNQFLLEYESKNKNHKQNKWLRGIFQAATSVHLIDAKSLDNFIEFNNSTDVENEIICGKVQCSGEWEYLCIYRPVEGKNLSYKGLREVFAEIDSLRQNVAERLTIRTPDPYINTLGGALAVAADAIWESPAYHHGAIAWRQQLNGWRGAYVADQLGWHDRARTHFAAYAKSQLTFPESGPVTPDTSRNLARQEEKIGTAMFTSGYISRYPEGQRLRAHHYDMNQVFIDQLIRHFDWTGDVSFLQEMWPVIKRHLAWEKRCFDTDGNALYDAYCSFWASDAVQYSGGGVTHASAYQYYANKRAAEFASILGKDPHPFLEEANRIKSAINDLLWLPERGYYAEYKDLLGKKIVHDVPGVWTIYHALDEGIADPFQAYQAMEYINNHIPKIPIIAHGLDRQDYYTISTTNWMPYTWSVNNVALAEVMHTSLAYWQAGRKEEAFLLWKSALLESMYLGASPGSIQQLSFYDAMRGELYRDFADPIGMTARSLVEGLFGVHPQLMEKCLVIEPGFPAQWDQASISTPDIDYEMIKSNLKEEYRIRHHFIDIEEIILKLDVVRGVDSVLVNGRPAEWKISKESIGLPGIEINIRELSEAFIEIYYNHEKLFNDELKFTGICGAKINLPIGDQTSISEVFDPQHCLTEVNLDVTSPSIILGNVPGNKIIFIKILQGEFLWWMPIKLKINKPVEITTGINTLGKNNLHITNYSGKEIHSKVIINGEESKEIIVSPGKKNPNYTLPDHLLVCGTNEIILKWDTFEYISSLINWEITNKNKNTYRSIDLTPLYNAEVDQVFNQQYLSPRPTSATVQLPTQGIGNWCYPYIHPELDDGGLRELTGSDDVFNSHNDIPFRTPGQEGKANIIFTSQWNNYPDLVTIPLKGKASHAYFLMAGTTNPMQSRIVNGKLTIFYQDGSKSELELINPDTWWPIEQDYYVDGYAFDIDLPKPPRIHLKTGLITRDFTSYTSIKGFTSTAIDGGAATILDLPLDQNKELKSLRLECIANDVVIGLMSVSLIEKPENEE